jgi:hypothetical protein
MFQDEGPILHLGLLSQQPALVPRLPDLSRQLGQPDSRFGTTPSHLDKGSHYGRPQADLHRSNQEHSERRVHLQTGDADAPETRSLQEHAEHAGGRSSGSATAGMTVAMSVRRRADRPGRPMPKRVSPAGTLLRVQASDCPWSSRRHPRLPLEHPNAQTERSRQPPHACVYPQRIPSRRRAM